jgi:hypothetical protein
MAFELTGRRSVTLAAILLVSAGLSACTTTEGTNAFTSADVFEREVMTSTAQGLGLVPQSVKPDPTNPRGPLVMPKSNADLPPPEAATSQAALLPEDSTKAKIDTSGLTQDDLTRLRNARVVDLNTPGGRPLTDAEVRKLTSRMKNYTLKQKRSIFVPPEQYYTLADATKPDLVCLALDGELVALNDPACPPEIRSALLKKKR